MTLLTQLTKTISASGPLSLSDYMRVCLTDPAHGYYTTQKPIGTTGDFITAPEVSQIFGELIGLWAVQEWLALGSPATFTLLELGPGHGTLMADALRAAKLRPQFLQGMHLYMLEVSPRLQQKQQETLADYTIHHIHTLHNLPEQPTLVIANEFFDALPIEQYRLTQSGWQQRTIDVQNGALTFAERGATPPEYIQQTSSRTWIEHCPDAIRIIDKLAHHIAAHRGAGLFIDYGYLGPTAGDTLQAVKQHAYSDVLADPGTCDLTAHVDFGTLARTAHNAGCRTAFMTQREFLLMMGADVRAEQLNDASGFQRLTGKDQMGDLFKTLLINT